ncbi:elongation of very long chain fatty acids protein 1-like [Uranotaenia lowii]|uniref:elongation of very long chain fatty acids protein 1-like n=1 Tax=Uranotaenia lowii TaxID=190385 RepID=UPI00247919A0|nr:elongation of very long chain fatty acids protein 1-like [Uranotaenia lowii]
MDASNLTFDSNIIRSLYTYIVEDLADPRAKNLPLLHNPMWVVSSIVIYLILVLNIVPKWMVDKKPFKLYHLILVYDAIEIIGSGIAIYLFFKHGWRWSYFHECKTPDFSDDPNSLGFLRAAYFTYLLKLSELIETVMYALRKKNNQISAFHVYHHCYALVTSWGFAKYGGGSMLSYTIIVNSIVHVGMYTYYLLSIYAQKLPFSLIPLKKLVTVLQIFQLITVLGNLANAMKSTCTVPILHCLYHGPNMALQIKLFLDFYNSAYRSKPNDSMNKNHQKTQ